MQPMIQLKMRYPSVKSRQDVSIWSSGEWVDDERCLMRCMMMVRCWVAWLWCMMMLKWWFMRVILKNRKSCYNSQLGCQCRRATVMPLNHCTATSKYTHVDHMCHTYDVKIIIVSLNTKNQKYTNLVHYVYYTYIQRLTQSLFIPELSGPEPHSR